MDTAVTTYLLTSLLRRGLGQRSERHLHSKIAAIFFLFIVQVKQRVLGEMTVFFFSPSDVSKVGGTMVRRMRENGWPSVVFIGESLEGCVCYR